ncbi:MAG: helix-turn-helix transcriptional regulator [Candidatus Binatia bacterium]
MTYFIKPSFESLYRARYYLSFRPGDDYPDRRKQFRARRDLTQQALADRLAVCFPTVNRWENGQTKPSQLSWKRLRPIEMEV